MNQRFFFSRIVHTDGHLGTPIGYSVAYSDKEVDFIKRSFFKQFHRGTVKLFEKKGEEYVEVLK